MKPPVEDLSTVFAREILLAAIKKEAKENLGQKYIPKKFSFKITKHWKATFCNRYNKNFLVEEN